MGTVKHATLDNAELARRWAARCASGNFSPAVRGKGTISVMGKSGDEPFAFPLISSLAVLDEQGALAPDEAWAVRAAQDIFREKSVLNGRKRQVFGRNGSEQATVVKEFNPALEQIIVTNMTAGG